MARPRKPTKKLDREGAFRVHPERRRTGEPDPDPMEPVKPADLKGHAEHAWEEMTGFLRQMGVLSRSDTHMLALYCRAYADYMRCQEATEKAGIVSLQDGKAKRNPFDQAKKDYYNLMMRILGRFGLSPADRAQLDVTKMADESQDPFLRIAKMRG